VDFSSAVEFTKQPKGLSALWGKILGWAGNLQVVIQFFLAMDTAAKKKRASRV
jgi:hypothetical protein